MESESLFDVEIRGAIIKSAYEIFFKRDVDDSGYEFFSDILTDFDEMKNFVVMILTSEEGRHREIYVSDVADFIDDIVSDGLCDSEAAMKSVYGIAKDFSISAHTLNNRINIEDEDFGQDIDGEGDRDFISWHVEEDDLYTVNLIAVGCAERTLGTAEEELSSLGEGSAAWKYRFFTFDHPSEGDEDLIEITVKSDDETVHSYVHDLRISKEELLNISRQVVGSRARTLSDKDRALVLKTGIFDERWYRNLYSDVDFASVRPIDHFLDTGVFEERSPHPLFVPKYFRNVNPGISTDIPSFISYISNKSVNAYKTSPLLDSDAYYYYYSDRVAGTPTRTALEDFCRSDDNSEAFSFFDPDFYSGISGTGAGKPFNRVLEDFLTVGLVNGHGPTPLIDLDFIGLKGSLIERYGAFCGLFDETSDHDATHPLIDVPFFKKKSPHISVNPTIAYFRRGRTGENLYLNPLFDENFYRRNYGSMMQHPDPFVDFLNSGAERKPNHYFDTAFYREAHGDKLANGMHPIQHYCRYGTSPYLEVGKAFGQRFYLRRHPEIARASVQPLVDFLHGGQMEKRLPLPPRPFFETALSSTDEELCAEIRAADKGRASAEPVASIIVPSYNNTTETLRCILSVLHSSDVTPFRVCLVDDASPDGSGARLSAGLSGLDAVHVHVNAENLGFLRSCNTAAERAEGSYLYFLNNDTIVTDGWLDELMGVFEREENVGVAGAKLVYPNGLLQEAGGIVWQEAAAANFGRMDDPAAPEFNYQRDVDYISGAAILVSREAWDAVDGFSDVLAPAYYEDSELAMKMRDKGLRVIYQPLAEVIHDEGMSSGVDLGSGVKRFQTINKQKVADLWREQLDTMGEPGDYSRDVVDRASIGRILFYEAEAPRPDTDSGSVTTFNYLKILCALGYRVTFIAQNLRWEGKYSRDMQRLGVEVLHAPYVDNARQFILNNAQNYDMVFMARAPVIGSLMLELKEKFSELPIVFDTVDIHHLRMERQAALEGDPAIRAAAEEMKQLELSLLRISDVSLLVSTYEERYIRNQIGSFPHVILPLIYDDAGTTPPYDERKDFAFVGGYRHPPNVDAVEYLVSEIWPKYKALGGDAKLHLIGSNMPQEFSELADDDIVVVGFVDDLEAYLADIRVSLCPLRYGAGVKGKVGNSLRLGLPVIGTPTAIEGMGLVDGETVLMGASPDRFARQMQRLYDDPALWADISAKGREYAEENYSIGAARKTLRTMCRSLLHNRNA